MTSYDDPVFSTREGGVAEIVLNRPARRNAVTGPLAERLHAEIVAATEDDDIAVLLLRGAGGADEHGLAAPSPPGERRGPARDRGQALRGTGVRAHGRGLRGRGGR